MANSSVSRSVVIKNPQGLHARPATLLATTACQFSAKVELVIDERRVDAKSVMHVLTLGATQGTELLLEACGDDAQQAVEALAQLVDDGFADTELLGQEQAG